MPSRAHCEVVREAISARVDREEAPTLAAVVDEHLDRCARCRAFEVEVAAIAEMTRRSAIASADAVPDMADRVLFALACAERRSGRGRALRAWFPRTRWGWAAGWAAAALPLGVAAPMLAVGGPAHVATHLVAHAAVPAAALPHAARPCSLALIWPRRS